MEWFAVRHVLQHNDLFEERITLWLAASERLTGSLYLGAGRVASSISGSPLAPTMSLSSI
jgi:hypothetical protein